jgi:hypothetical protein
VSDAVIVGVIAAIPATLLGLAALVTALRGNRQTKALELSINGRLTQLLAAVSAEQHAAGRAEGVEAERNR